MSILDLLLDPDESNEPVLRANPQALISTPFVIDGGDLQALDIASESDAPPIADRELEHAHTFQPPAPVPLIGVVPFGGIIVDAGVIDNSAGAAAKIVSIGSNDSARPAVLGVLIRCTAGVVSIMPNGSPDSLGQGFILPVNTAAPMFFPLKRANLNVAVAGVVTWAVIGSDIP